MIQVPMALNCQNGTRKKGGVASVKDPKSVEEDAQRKMLWSNEDQLDKNQEGVIHALMEGVENVELNTDSSKT